MTVYTKYIMACFSFQDWAKPGPYDQPVVNTLRKKKDKEAPAVVHNNNSMSSNNGLGISGLTSIMPSTPAPAELQPPAPSLEETLRTVAAPLKVSALTTKCLSQANTYCRRRVFSVQPVFYSHNGLVMSVCNCPLGSA